MKICLSCDWVVTGKNEKKITPSSWFPVHKPQSTVHWIGSNVSHVCLHDFMIFPLDSRTLSFFLPWDTQTQHQQVQTILYINKITTKQKIASTSTRTNTWWTTNIYIRVDCFAFWFIFIYSTKPNSKHHDYLWHDITLPCMIKLCLNKIQK